MKPSITLEDNFLSFAGRLDDLARQEMPFAMAQAINLAADEATDAVAAHFEKVLDRPRAFTLKGLRVKKAMKARPVATVFVLPIQSRYLSILETGGTRRPRRERLLDPVNTRLNKFGNVPRRQVETLLAKRNVFRGTVRGIDGIWQRQPGGRRLKLLIAFDRSQAYRPVIRFELTVEKTVSETIRRNFGKTLAQAVARTKAKATAKALGL